MQNEYCFLQNKQYVELKLKKEFYKGLNTNWLELCENANYNNLEKALEVKLISIHSEQVYENENQNSSSYEEAKLILNLF